jgi:hypothetical protein
MNGKTETTSPAAEEPLTREEELSFLFAQMVMQQSNMAMMLMGKVAHPETGKVVQDVEAARFFIDQLEMLEVKTKGNLSKDEESLLKQTLMTLRLSFVDIVESSASSKQQPKTPTPQEQTSPRAEADQAPADEPTDDEHRKKFSKKY